MLMDIRGETNSRRLGASQLSAESDESCASQNRVDTICAATDILGPQGPPAEWG
jgi:hypothetical protein